MCWQKQRLLKNSYRTWIQSASPLEKGGQKISAFVKALLKTRYCHSSALCYVASRESLPPTSFVVNEVSGDSNAATKYLTHH
jgi:hypothetical protein